MLWEDAAHLTSSLSRQIGGRTASGPGKPVTRGEMALGDADDYRGDANHDQSLDTTGVWLHTFLWGQINPGGLYELYWDPVNIRRYNLYGHFRAFRDFMDGIPLNNGRYADARAAASHPDLIVLGQADRTAGRGHLYVRHRQYTWRNAVDGVAIPPVAGSIAIPDLTDGVYRVVWWDAWQGTPVLTQTVAASVGNLTVTVPILLTGDIALQFEPEDDQDPSFRLWLPLVLRGEGRPATATPVATNTPTPANTPTRTATPTSMPTRTATPTNTATPAPTATPTATPTPGSSPTPTATSPSTGAQEWSQHAHDAQHTGYTAQTVAYPWRLRWIWNGASPTGGVSKVTTDGSLPRNVQPVTGGGRVYIAAGVDGVFALGEATGAQLWQRSGIGDVRSTVAYDADTEAVFVVSADGNLYKLRASDGAVLATFNSGRSSTLPLPPAVIGDRVLFSMGNSVFAVYKVTMAAIWTYNAGATMAVPPAYSPSHNLVIVATEPDLYVHAVRNSDGARQWRVRPVPASRNFTDPTEYRNGWPVIAEAAGYVLVKVRLDWNTLWRDRPQTNEAMRQFLAANPDQQAIFVLDDGTVPFIAGHIVV